MTMENVLVDDTYINNIKSSWICLLGLGINCFVHMLIGNIFVSDRNGELYKDSQIFSCLDVTKRKAYIGGHWNND